MQSAVNYVRQIGVVADIEGIELTASDCEFLLQPEVTGIILFSRNYQSPEQLTALTKSISELRSGLLICVDQEGGRVQRLRDGFTRLPPMLKLEDVFLCDRKQGLTLAENLGWLMSLELLEHGVHLSFAPVLDIERDVSRVIGDRAFAHDADAVTELAGAFITGMQSLGMAAVGKHFPGHGAVEADSHIALPVDERNCDEIHYDMQPFAELVQQHKLTGVMPAHVIYPEVDPIFTAGFSTIWLQTILRQQLKFDGVIFSDDLSMAGAAAAGNYIERTEKAISAGCNALLACNDREAATDVVATVRRILKKNPQLQPLDLSDLQPDKLKLTAAEVQRREQVQQQITALLS